MHGHRWFLRLGGLTNSSLAGLIQDANELIHCSYSLSQGTDYKGKPQTGIRVGDITLTYDGLPSNDIIKWAMKSTLLYDGVLVLCDANDIPVDKVYFEDAVCVSMRIIYVGEGKSPIITQIQIQPRKLVIGEEDINRNWQSLLKTNMLQKGASQVEKLFKMARPIGKITIDLELGGKTYDVEHFDIAFRQGVDYKGEPQEDMTGGLMHFTIASHTDKQLSKWMVKSDEAKDGVFVFKQGDQNSPLKIKFQEGYCVNMQNKTTLASGVSTSYTVSANEVDLNGCWLYKNFRIK